MRRGALSLAAVVVCMAVAGATVAVGNAVLERGDHGPAVVKLQRKLHLHADGAFGRQTERAVKRFQRRHGLPADGIVDRATRRALGLRLSRAASRRTANETGGAAPGQVRRRRRLPRVLRRIAKCESGGDPTRVSRDGRYRGKYQFTRSMWKRMGGQGDPATAPEWLQDRLALRLYRKSGTDPWPSCGG
jgi:resuscitation-promoting factor RpfB